MDRYVYEDEWTKIQVCRVETKAGEDVVFKISDINPGSGNDWDKVNIRTGPKFGENDSLRESINYYYIYYCLFFLLDQTVTVNVTDEDQQGTIITEEMRKTTPDRPVKSILEYFLKK